MPGPIITRESWGARFPDGFGEAHNPATELWLHHSVTTPAPATGSRNQDIDTVQHLEAIGQARFGGGISYTFCVPPSGRIFQGHSVTREGAHTYGHNTVGRGIVLIGNYDILSPNEAQVDAVRWLIAEGYRRRWWTIQRLTGGHRDTKQTDCPGNLAYAAIPMMNIPWPSIPAPTPVPAPVPAPPPLPKHGDVMFELEVSYYDAGWRPDPAGLNFRAVAPIEVGSGSQVVARGWLRWAAHWGTATFSAMSWDQGGKPVAMPIRGEDYAEIPPGSRKVTVEGTRGDAGVRIGCALLVLTK